MKIKKGDTVFIKSGDDKGKKGKVIKAFPKDFKILVEGVNVQKKHQKPKREGEKGQIVQKSAPIFVSNAILICPKCQKKTKIAYLKNEKKKNRFCKKCRQIIG